MLLLGPMLKIPRRVFVTWLFPLNCLVVMATHPSQPAKMASHWHTFDTGMVSSSLQTQSEGKGGTSGDVTDRFRDVTKMDLSRVDESDDVTEDREYRQFRDYLDPEEFVRKRTKPTVVRSSKMADRRKSRFDHEPLSKGSVSEDKNEKKTPGTADDVLLWETETSGEAKGVSQHVSTDHIGDNDYSVPSLGEASEKQLLYARAPNQLKVEQKLKLERSTKFKEYYDQGYSEVNENPSLIRGKENPAIEEDLHLLSGEIPRRFFRHKTSTEMHFHQNLQRRRLKYYITDRNRILRRKIRRPWFSILGQKRDERKEKDNRRNDMSITKMDIMHEIGSQINKSPTGKFPRARSNKIPQKSKETIAFRRNTVSNEYPRVMYRYTTENDIVMASNGIKKDFWHRYQGSVSVMSSSGRNHRYGSDGIETSSSNLPTPFLKQRSIPQSNSGASRLVLEAKTNSIPRYYNTPKRYASQELHSGSHSLSNTESFVNNRLLVGQRSSPSTSHGKVFYTNVDNGGTTVDTPLTNGQAITKPIISLRPDFSSDKTTALTRGQTMVISRLDPLAPIWRHLVCSGGKHEAKARSGICSLLTRRGVNALPKIEISTNVTPVLVKSIRGRKMRNKRKPVPDGTRNEIEIPTMNERVDKRDNIEFLDVINETKIRNIVEDYQSLLSEGDILFKSDPKSHKPYNSKKDNRPDSKRGDRSDLETDGRLDSEKDNRPDSKKNDRPDSEMDDRLDSKDDRPDSRKNDRPDSEMDDRLDSKMNDRPDSRKDDRSAGIRLSYLNKDTSSFFESIWKEMENQNIRMKTGVRNDNEASQIVVEHSTETDNANSNVSDEELLGDISIIRVKRSERLDYNHTALPNDTTSSPDEASNETTREDVSCLPSNKLAGRSKVRDEDKGQVQHTINMAVLAPLQEHRLFTIERTGVAIDIALERVVERRMVPSNYRLLVHYGNTYCSISDSMNAAINLQRKGTVVFLGPICDYAVAPVARQIRYWKIPMLTPGAMAADFGFNKPIMFPFLTRLGTNFNSLLYVVEAVIAHFKWHKIKILYHPDGFQNVMDRYCHIAVDAIVYGLRKVRSNITEDHISFHSTDYILEHLEKEIGTDSSERWMSNQVSVPTCPPCVIEDTPPNPDCPFP